MLVLQCCSVKSCTFLETVHFQDLFAILKDLIFCRENYVGKGGGVNSIPQEPVNEDAPRKVGCSSPGRDRFTSVSQVVTVTAPRQTLYGQQVWVSPKADPGRVFLG